MTFSTNWWMVLSLFLKTRLFLSRPIDVFKFLFHYILFYYYNYSHMRRIYPNHFPFKPYQAIMLVYIIIRTQMLGQPSPQQCISQTFCAKYPSKSNTKTWRRKIQIGQNWFRNYLEFKFITKHPKKMLNVEPIVSLVLSTQKCYHGDSFDTSRNRCMYNYLHPQARHKSTVQILNDL